MLARASVAWLLGAADPDRPESTLAALVESGFADLPMPGSGRTLERWRTLAEIAAHDLSLVKLFEGHTDALAVMQELGAAASDVPAGSTWGMWAAEPPDARVIVHRERGGEVRLHGLKRWCSGASSVSHALMTVWTEDGAGPFLAAVALDQPGIQAVDHGWHAVGMAASRSVEVRFEGAAARVVGERGAYLARPGFWQGGAGIAACWYGGTVALAQALHRAAHAARAHQANPIRDIALGRVDLALQGTAALLRAAASWIDAHPRDDAHVCALRVRLSAEASARGVLDEVGRALGAAPYCLDARFARMAADLPVFVRQSGADRDFAALGASVATQSEADCWSL